MVGLRAFALDMVAVGVVSGLVAATLRLLRQDFRWRGVVVVLVLAVSVAGVAVRMASTAHGYHRLRNLHPDSLRSVRIGEAELSDRSELSRLTSCLNQVRWFSFNHGGGSTKRALVITDRSGESEVWTISRYGPIPGALIEFGYSRLRFYRGVVYVPCVPPQLEDPSPQATTRKDAPLPGRL